MKKMISILMSFIIGIECFCIASFNVSAVKSEKYNKCYIKLIFPDDSVVYAHTIVKDNCLMADAEWLCKRFGLNYNKINPSKILKQMKKTANYFISKSEHKPKWLSKESQPGFAVSKKDCDLSFVFLEGKSEAEVSSFYINNYSIDIGGDVFSATDENGNSTYYVPFFAFCDIFNIGYNIYPEPEKNYIKIYEPTLTAIDIMHMQDKLYDYKMQNCLVNAINDDVLAFLLMTFGEALDNAIESALTFKVINGIDPTKDNYENLVLQMCSSDTDEISALNNSGEKLNFIKDVYSTFYDEMLKFVQESCTNGSLKKKMDIYKDMYKLVFKHDFKISLKHFEDYYKKYKSIKDISKTVKIADVFNTSVNVSFPIFFNSVALVAEMSSVQDRYVKSINVYLDYADEKLDDDKLQGHKYIRKKVNLYKSSNGTTFDKLKNIIFNENMLSSIILPFEEIINLQLGNLGLAATAGKWGINYIMGGVFDFKDIYFNCMVNQKFENSAEKVVDTYINSSDFNIDTYRALEWTRLKSYYVAQENALELYKQYYDTLKFNADNNEVLDALLKEGFGKKQNYTNDELQEYYSKIDNDSDISEIDNAFNDYNMMNAAKKLLDTESKRINSDTTKLAEYMAVLLYGIDGTTSENTELCEEISSETNNWVVENNCALYQAVEGTVLEAEEKTPVKDADVSFVSEDGTSVSCSTDNDGNMIGLEKSLLNSFADDLNGGKNTKGILEENDIEKENEPFSQYDPNVKVSKVELYLPIGSYSLEINASGYEGYKHEDEIKVEFGERYNIGEILLESENIEWYLEPSIEADDINVLDAIRENANYGEYIKSDCFVIKKNNKFGLINIEGEVIILPDYKYAFGFLYDHIMLSSDDYIKEICYCTNNKVSVYQGDFICKSCKNQYAPTTDYESNYVFDVDKGLLAQVGGAWNISSDQFTFFGQNGYGIISSKEILTARSADFPDDIENIDNSSHNPIMGTVKEKYGVVKNGTVILDFEYEAATSYIDGVAALSQNGKWGYVNSKGEIIIPFEYNGAYEYDTFFANNNEIVLPYLPSEGYIALSNEKGAGYYDIEGNEVIPVGTFEKARPVHNGKAWVKDKKTGLWGIIKLSENDELDILVEKARTMYKDNGEIESVYAIVELDDELCLIEGRRLSLSSYYNLYNSKNELIHSHSSVPLNLYYNNDIYSLYAPFAAGDTAFIDAVYPENIDSYLYYPNHIDVNLKEVKVNGYIELNDEEYEEFHEKSVDLQNMHKIQYYHDGMCEYIELK